MSSGLEAQAPCMGNDCAAKSLTRGPTPQGTEVPQDVARRDFGNLVRQV